MVVGVTVYPKFHPLQSIDQLSQIEAFEDVPADQLEWLVRQSQCLNFDGGEFLFEKDQAADHFYVVLEGCFTIYFFQNGQKNVVSQMETGDLGGVLPYSRMTEARGYCQADEPSKVLALHRDHFPEMIRDHHELTSALVHQMTNRVRSFTRSRLQDEKLLSLGKLSAGLAHELNNPASAIVRSSQALTSHLKLLPGNFKRVIRIRMTDQEVDVVNDLLFRRIEEYEPGTLGLMERSDREDELTEWLEDHGFEDGMEIAENLVEFGFSMEDVECILEKTGPEHFPPVIAWVDNNLTTEKMVCEIAEASGRIAELVQSIKGYTHMDRAKDRQAVPVAEGIRSTLTMLAHKVKQNKVQVEEDFAADLRDLHGFPGEINQVWTNIIDNALDALEENGGTLKIRAFNDREFVRVQIEDNGPGIPEDDQSRVFDPFFTTKEMGKGTGMGLDIVQKIVLNHQGRVKVDSQPGKTVFDLCFPAQ